MKNGHTHSLTISLYVQIYNPTIQRAQQSIIPTTPPIPQQRPQIVFSSEVYHRPVLSLPPVVLMGGDNSQCYVSSHNRNSCGPLHISMPSPIVEMPPSPAPNTLMYVEFPDDEVDDVKIIDVHNIVEVRTDFIISFLFCFKFSVYFFFAAFF